MAPAMPKLTILLALALLAVVPAGAAAGPHHGSGHGGLTNRAEKKAGRRPPRKDADRAGTRDALEDPARARVNNLAGALAHTPPRRVAPDRDGLCDGRGDSDRARLVNAVE